MPGLSGVEKPIVPESRTTGTTGVRSRQRLGSRRRNELRNERAITIT